MSTIELPFSVLIYSVVGFISIGGTLVAVYVSLSNTISNHTVRIHELEKKVVRTEAVLDEHDEKFVQMFSEIKEGIHRLELSIEKLR